MGYLAAKDLTPFTTLVEDIDLDRVAAEIKAGLPPGFLEDQYYHNVTLTSFEAIKEMVWHVAEKFLPRDLHDLAVTSLESPFEKWVPVPYRGIIDVGGTVLGRSKAMSPYAGKLFVLDWKTTGMKFDGDWRRYYLDSWQWRLYAHAKDATLFLYRVVSWSEADVRELVIEIPANNGKEVRLQVGGMSDLLEGLSGLVYPRNFDACKKYGRDCPFLGECRTGTMPAGYISPPEFLSHTSMQNLLTCPEKYRRLRLSEGDASGDEAEFGKGFHRGIAELYKQAYKISSS